MFLGQAPSKGTIVQKIGDESLQLQTIADSLRVETDDPLINDVPDIYDYAYSLLQTIITCKENFDPNAVLLKQMADFETDLLGKEKQFTQECERKLNSLSNRLYQYQNSFEDIEILQKETIQNIPLIFKSKVSDIQKVYNVKLQDNIKTWKEQEKEKLNEIEELKNDQKKDLEEYESSLTTISQAKINEIEDQIKERKSVLQSTHQMVNDRNRKDQEEYRRLENKFEREYENEQASTAQLRSAFDYQLKQLETQYDELENDLESKNNALKTCKDDYENELANKKEEITQKNDEEFKKLMMKVNRSLELLKYRHDDYEQAKAMALLKLNHEEQALRVNLTEEKTITENLLKEKLKEEEDYLNSELEKINKQIFKSEKEKASLLEDLRKALITKIEVSEERIIELNHQHQEAQSKMREEIRKLKMDLQKALTDRSTEIDRTKDDIETLIQQVEEEIKVENDDYQQKIDLILETTRKKQQEIDEKTQFNIDNLNKKRIEGKARIDKEHAFKMRSIQFQAEQKQQNESEKAYKEGIAEATRQHQAELDAINSNISNLHRDMRGLKEKLNQLKINNKHELETLSKDKQKELALTLQDLKIKHKEDQNSLKTDLTRFESNKKALEKQVQELNQEIDKNKLRYEEIMAAKLSESGLELVRLQLMEQLKQLQKEQNDLIFSKAKFEKDNQKREHKCHKLKREADKHQKEFTIFDESFDSKVKEATQDKIDAGQREMEQKEKEKRELNHEISNQREEIQHEINDISENLKSFQKQTEEDIQNAYLNKKLAEENVETDLIKQFEDEEKELTKNHERRLTELSEEKIQLKEKHEKKMINLSSSFEEERVTEYQINKDKVLIVECELEEKIKEREKLESVLKAKEVPKCPECEDRKETILRLNSKKEELMQKLEGAKQKGEISEEKLNQLFGIEQNIAVMNNKQTINNSSPKSARKLTSLSSLATSKTSTNPITSQQTTNKTSKINSPNPKKAVVVRPVSRSSNYK